MTVKIPKIIRPSFALHSDAERKGLLTLYTETNSKLQDKEQLLEEIKKLHAKRMLLLDTDKLAAKRRGLPVVFNYYQVELAKTNPEMFAYLTEPQQLNLKNRLLYTYFLLLAQYQLDVAEGRAYNLLNYQNQLELCSKRIQELNLAPLRGKTKDPQDELQSEINLFTKCMYYLGLTILAQWIVERIEEFMNCKTGAINRWLSEINVKRLYWIWGGGMLGATLELLPDSFFNTVIAGETLAKPSPVSGYMSFILYYLRFGINLYLLAKHTLGGPWMSAEESAIPPWERFKTQWNIRKFSMLNDLIWGPINMVCFLWLYGRGMMGYAGNLATILLLAGDLILTLWRHWEETAQHEANMAALRKDMTELDEKIRAHELTQRNNWLAEEKKRWQEELKLLNAQRKELDEIKDQAEFEWKYKDLATWNDCCYAFGLLLSFIVVACFFFPPTVLAPLTIMIFGLVGAVACFLVTTAYTAYGSYLEREKTLELAQRKRDKCTKLLESFEKENDPDQKRQLYLQMKALMAEAYHQDEMAHFQIIKGVRSFIIDAVFPFVVFTSLVFLPVGAGIGIIAATLYIAMHSYFIMNAFEPKAPELPEFIEEDYNDFLENQSLSHFEEQEEAKQNNKYKRRLFDSVPSQDYYDFAEEGDIALQTLSARSS